MQPRRAQGLQQFVPVESIPGRAGGDQPWLVETGILLDVFVAVFVMGIAIFHISREFDHMDVDQLTVLKD